MTASTKTTLAAMKKARTPVRNRAGAIRGQGKATIPLNQARQTMAARPARPGNIGEQCRGVWSGMKVQNNMFGQVQQWKKVSNLRPSSSQSFENPGRNVHSA